MSAERNDNAETMPSESEWTYQLCFTGLKLKTYAKASRTLASWAAGQSNQPTGMSHEDTESLTLTGLCMLDTTEHDLRARNALLTQWESDAIDMTAVVQLYHQLHDSRELLQIEAKRKAASINPLELMDVIFANFRFSAHAEIMTAVSRDRKEHVQTAADILTQFAIFDEFSANAENYAAWIPQHRKDKGRQNEPKEDIISLAILLQYVIYSLRDNPEAQMAFINTLGSEEMSIVTRYESTIKKLPEIEKNARLKARNMNAAGRLRLAVRATNLILKKDALKEHKHSVSKALLTKTELKKIAVSGLVTAGAMTMSWAFNILAPMALLKDTGFNWHSQLGATIIGMSYILNYGLSFTTTFEFLSALKKIGFAPNGIVTGLYYSMRKLIPEHTWWQTFILFVANSGLGMADDIPAALTLIANRGGSYVVLRNLLTATLAGSALIASYRLRNNPDARFLQEPSDSE